MIELTNLINIGIPLSIIFSVSALGQLASQNCPPSDYNFIIKYYDNLCYQFIEHEMYWTDAEEFCQKQGGRLLKVTDKKVNEFIIQSLNEMKWWTNNGVWLGLNDLKSDSNWVWSNKKNEFDEPLLDDFTYWSDGQPDGWFTGIRNCVRMVRGWGDWKWYETPCYTYFWTYRSICQFEALPKTTHAPVALPIQQVFTYENLKIGVEKAPGVSEKVIGDSTNIGEPSKTSLIVSLCLLVVVIIFCLVMLFQFRKLKRKTRIMKELLCSKGFPMQREPMKEAHLYEYCPKGALEAGDKSANGVVECVFSIGDLGSKKKCENWYVEEGLHSKMVEKEANEKENKMESIYEEVPFRV